MPRSSRAARVGAPAAPLVAPLVALALLAAPAVLRAQPACVAGTFLDYVSLGAAGCTIGGVRVGGAAVPAGAPASYAARATFTPFSAALGGGRTLVGFDIAWDAPLAVPDPARPTANAAGWTARFDVATLSGAIVGVHVGDVFAALVPGTLAPPGYLFVESSLTAYELGQVGQPTELGWARRRLATSCAGPASCVEAGTDDVAPRQALTASVFATASAAAARPQDFGASATLAGTRLGFVVQPGASTLVPEPGTCALLGAGLVGVAAAARRRRGG